VWELINKGMIEEKPFACHGLMWKKMVRLMEDQIAIENRKSGLIKCFDEIDDCADYIISRLK
jgi:hypothetical protein